MLLILVEFFDFCRMLSSLVELVRLSSRMSSTVDCRLSSVDCRHSTKFVELEFAPCRRLVDDLSTTCRRLVDDCRRRIRQVEFDLSYVVRRVSSGRVRLVSSSSVVVEYRRRVSSSSVVVECRRRRTRNKTRLSPRFYGCVSFRLLFISINKIYIKRFHQAFRFYHIQ